MVVMTPRVVDVSHYEKVTSYSDAVDAGLWAAICKCTQGSGSNAFADHTYNANIIGFRKEGALVGAYHFGDGTDPRAQVDWFVKNANYSKDMLMALDFEDYPKSNMTAYSMVLWLRYFEEKMGFKAVLYTGNRLKDHWDELNAEDKAYVILHRLWLAEYNPSYHLPKGFTKLFIWQYTGDGAGNTPHWINGITLPGGKGLDLNSYDGTREQLSVEWGVTMPAVSANTVAQVPQSKTSPVVPIAHPLGTLDTSKPQGNTTPSPAGNTVTSKPPVNEAEEIIEKVEEGVKHWLGF